MNVRNGINSLTETKNDIKTLQLDIEKKKDELKVKCAEQSDLKKFIEMESIRAQETSNKVESERLLCLKEQEKSQALEDSCSKDLEEAMPILEKAQDAIKRLDSKMIGEIKAYKHIDPVIKIIMDMILLALQKPIEKEVIYDKHKMKKETHEFFKDSWEHYGKQELFNPKFLANLRELKGDQCLNEETCELLEP